MDVEDVAGGGGSGKEEEPREEASGGEGPAVRLGNRLEGRKGAVDEGARLGVGSVVH